MQSPAQRCARLIAALEDLAAQEEASLQALDFPALDSIQARAGALVDDLVSHASFVAADGALRARIVAVHARRERSAAWLATEMARARAEMDETQVAQRRVSRIAPVYGSGPAGGRASSQLSVVG